MRLATRGSYAAACRSRSGRWTRAASGPAKPPSLKSVCARSIIGASSSTTEAPAARSAATARPNAAFTCGSSSAKRPHDGRRSRRPAIGRAASAAAALGAPPASTLSSSAQQLIELASGPTESSVCESGKTPSRGTRACVGLKPVMPQSADGIRIEPRVSDPMLATHMPSVTATAAPHELPPGMRPPDSRSYGFLGVPKCGLRPTPPNANSTVFVRPIITAPAARRRETTGASHCAGG
eukprot:4996229-Prymnesium_polylepis.1